MLRLLPKTAHPDLLVGFESSDDAGVFRLSETLVIVQTVDFFTPIVDDPYAYGAIAAANSLSDIYAMGGRPLTALNIFCFDPSAAPAEVWAAILQGGYDKTIESGAVLLGGHTVEDDEPKFGMAVTGLVDPSRMFTNTSAKPGDYVQLTKPIGTGIVTTAHKMDRCEPHELAAAIDSMSTLNRAASELALTAGVRCATDITGFGLAGHLYNVARNSEVEIEIHAETIPLLPGVERMTAEGLLTGGAGKNRQFLGEALELGPEVSPTQVEVVLDPQTSGGLATFSRAPIPGFPVIGRVRDKGRDRICVQ